MHRTVVVVTLAAGMLLAGCGGGPSDKQQASKVGVAFRRAVLTADYENQWKLHAKGSSHGDGTYGQYASAEDFAAYWKQYDMKHPSPTAPWPPDTTFTVETIAKQTIQQGDFYRVRIRVEAKGRSLHSVDDVLVGKYRGKWLVGGGPVAPGESAPVEPIR
jgi:hypothetical protein